MGAFSKSVLTENSVRLAFSVLQSAAIKDPTLVQRILSEVAADDPNGIKKLLKLASAETFGDVVAAAAGSKGQSYPLVIGQAVTDSGVFWGQTKSGGNTVNWHIITDFLRNSDGVPVELNGNELIKSVADLNLATSGEKRQHGNGFWRAINKAIADGQFKDGTIVPASYDDLKRIASERETNPVLKIMNEIIASGSGSDSWSVSGTERSDTASYVSHVRLKDGGGDWSHKDNGRSRVVVLRGFTCG